LLLLLSTFMILWFTLTPAWLNPPKSTTLSLPEISWTSSVISSPCMARSNKNWLINNSILTLVSKNWLKPRKMLRLCKPVWLRRSANWTPRKRKPKRNWSWCLRSKKRLRCNKSPLRNSSKSWKLRTKKLKNVKLLSNMILLKLNQPFWPLKKVLTASTREIWLNWEVCLTLHKLQRSVWKPCCVWSMVELLPPPGVKLRNRCRILTLFPLWLTSSPISSLKRSPSSFASTISKRTGV